jgi:acyl-CoA synthetase (AMP-forming)/AMP-acid ligase II
MPEEAPEVQAVDEGPGKTPTLAAALARAARVGRDIDGLRVLDRRERPSFRQWADVHDRALRAAGTLAAAGVKPGDRVALILPTHLDFFDAFFGAIMLGAVPTPLYPPVRLGRLDEYFDKTVAMLEAADARALIVDKRVGRVIGRVLERWTPPCGLLKLEELATGEPWTGPGPGPDDLAMVQFSSGTTVAPKPVSLTHRQVLANARAIVGELFRAWPEDGFEHSGASWLPLYHDMGLIGCVFPAVDRARALTLLPPEVFLAKPGAWLRALSTYRATISPAPDFAYALCVERVTDEELAGVDLSCWRAALDGAEPIAPAGLRAFVDRFSAFGLRPEAVSPVYGLSEAALAVTFWPLDQPFRSVAFDRAALAGGRGVPAAADDPHPMELPSLGPPLLGFSVEIRDEDGIPVPEAVEGRIHVKGPSVMAGYLGRSEQPIVDGWLDTGDLGLLMDGELFITGRAKDVIVIRGQNHRPWEVERAADAVEGVRTGCSAAVGDASEGPERLLLFVEARAPRPELAEQCKKAVQAATGLEAALVVVLEPGTLPRTSSGKIRRAETRKQWLAGTLAPPDSVGPLLLAGALARSAWARFRHRS